MSFCNILTSICLAELLKMFCKFCAVKLTSSVVVSLTMLWFQSQCIIRPCVCGYQVPLLMPIQLLVAARRAISKDNSGSDAASQLASSFIVGRESTSCQDTNLAAGTIAGTRGHSPACDAKSNVSLGPPERAQWAAVIPSVVLISVPGTGRASGIVMSRDSFVLTNAHVVQPKDSQPPADQDQTRARPGPSAVKLRLTGSSSWHVADVVYIFKHVLDLAVLRIRAALSGLHLQPAVLQPHAVKAGQPIAAVGHALFSPSQSMLPTITTGNMSKVGGLCPLACSAMLWLHAKCCCCIARPCETSMLLQLCGGIECCLALLFQFCSLVKDVCRLCIAMLSAKMA